MEISSYKCSLKFFLYKSLVQTFYIYSLENVYGTSFTTKIGNSENRYLYSSKSIIKKLLLRKPII